MQLFHLQKESWNFPANNYGQVSGISDSGVETFNGTPMKSLAREICQNSIDANLKMETQPELSLCLLKLIQMIFPDLMI